MAASLNASETLALPALQQLPERRDYDRDGYSKYLDEIIFLSHHESHERDAEGTEHFNILPFGFLGVLCVSVVKLELNSVHLLNALPQRSNEALIAPQAASESPSVSPVGSLPLGSVVWILRSPIQIHCSCGTPGP